MVQPSLDGLFGWLTAGRAARAAWIVAVWVIAAILLRVLDRFFDHVDQRLTRYNVPERKLSKLDTLSEVLVVSLAALATLYLLGVGEALWGAIALTSLAGVIVGLAAQRFGENLIAGAVILFERPFRIGDVVEIDDQTGTVEAVTLHSTTLTSAEGLQVTLPNQLVLDGAVRNFSAREERRISLDVDVDVGTERLDEARQAIRQAIEADEHLVEDRDARVFASASLDEGVRFTARYWVEAEAFADHCEPTALRRVLDALEREGFATAMPAQTVHVREG